MLTKLFLMTLMVSLASCASGEKLSKTEKRAEIYYNYGTQYLVSKEYTKALDHLLKAYKLSPKDTKINNNLGMAYYLKDEHALAKSYFQRSLKLQPDNTDAKVNLASLYFSLNDLSKAESLYKEILKDLTYMRQYRTYYNLGLIYARRNDSNQAILHFKRAISEHEDYCPAHYQLGVVYKKMNQLAQAEKALTEGIKGVCYDEPAPHYQLGLVLGQLQNYEGAKRRFEYIVDKFDKTAFYSLATKELADLNTFRSQKTFKSRIESDFRYNLSDETDGNMNPQTEL